MEIEISDLNFAYKNFETDDDNTFFPPVIKNLNLKIEKGQHILIQGNGDSGKTTLSELLSGSYPDFLQGKASGKITIHDRNLFKCTPSDLILITTTVCQNSQNQILSTTCEDEIAFPLESLGIPCDQMMKKIQVNLDIWDLNDKRFQSPESLSGGERKRLLLAISTTINAPVIILDETFDELDTAWRNKLREYIASSDKTIIVFSSRFTNTFDGLFDTCYKMFNGKLEKTSQDILKNEKKVFPAFAVKKLISPKQIKAENIYITRGSDFSLSVPEFYLNQGEVVALKGKNGSGKTTFARCLSGIDPPNSGHFSIKPRLGKIGYIFQNPDYQIFLPTVMEELQYSVKSSKKDVEEICSLFSLNPEDICTTMSFAKRKYLQAATYFLLDRPFCIIDEIDSGLTGEQTRFLINQLRNKGAGILLISHEDFSTDWATRCYLIEDKVMKEKTL